MIKITCSGGSTRNCKIETHEGAEIKGVYNADIRLRVGEIPSATLSLHVNETTIDTIEAHPLLSFETVKAAADRFGYILVPK